MIPIAVLAAWSAFNYVDYGGIHIATRSHGVSGILKPLRFSLYWVVTIGGLTPLGLLAVAERLKNRPERRLVVYATMAAALIALAVLVAVGIVPDTVSDRILHVVFAANGVALMVTAVAVVVSSLKPPLLREGSVREMAPLMYLTLWIVGTTAFYVLLSPFIAARHVLLVLPPLLLLFGQSWHGSAALMPKLFGLGMTAVISLGLALSDWRFASFYKDEAAAIAESLPAGSHKWAIGVWGWPWYAALNGMPPVNAKYTKLQPGDFLIIATDVDPQILKGLQLIETLRRDPDLPSLICTARPARFYYSTEGPWSFSRHCGGRIDVYRMADMASIK